MQGETFNLHTPNAEEVEQDERAEFLKLINEGGLPSSKKVSHEISNSERLDYSTPRE